MGKPADCRTCANLVEIIEMNPKYFEVYCKVMNQPITLSLQSLTLDCDDYSVKKGERK